MAEHFVQGHKLYVGGRDFSSYWTALNLAIGRERIEWTKGQDTTRVSKMGLLTGALEAEGVIDFDADPSVGFFGLAQANGAGVAGSAITVDNATNGMPAIGDLIQFGSDSTLYAISNVAGAVITFVGTKSWADNEWVTLYSFSGLAKIEDQPIIIGAPGSTSGDEGTLAYGLRASVGDFTPIQGAIGERGNFTLSARASNTRPVRGTIFHDGDTARSATANGTARQLGAISSTQKLYAAIACLSGSPSDTLDVTVESDNAEGFPSATTRVTFAQIKAAGMSEWKELSGPITDDWWRIVWTIGGAGPSFRFVVLLAIH